MPGDATSASSSTASEPAATPRPISHPPPPDSRKLMPHPAPSREAPPRSRSPDWQRRQEPSQDSRGADYPLTTAGIAMMIPKNSTHTLRDMRQSTPHSRQ